MTWLNPLPIPIVLPPPHGQFGAIRKFDRHTGIDLYAPHGTNVYAVESGIVVAIDWFTGPSVGMPWWNNTRAVLVEGESGIVVYGEIQEGSISIGDHLEAGDNVGKVLTVLKKDKGLPMSMLHVELHTHYDQKHIWHPWELNKEKPGYLLDPAEKLPWQLGLIAYEEQHQINLDTHTWVKMSSDHKYYDIRYNDCICTVCGLFAFSTNDGKFFIQEDDDEDSISQDEMTCNEYLMSQILK